MLTRHSQNNLIWVDVVSPTAPEARALMQEFNLPAAVAQDLLVPSFSQKIERQGDVLYLILHFPALHGGRSSQEVDFIIGKHFLITARYETIDPLHVFAKAFEVDNILGRNQGSNHGGHLFIQMIRSLYRSLIEESETVRRRLIDIEEQIFAGDERRMVVEISHVARTVHDFRQALVPHREMFAGLGPLATRLFGTDFSYYLKELDIMHERLHATTTNLRESLAELRETNNSLLDTKQNEIMKTFTVLAFITFPLTLFVAIADFQASSNPLLTMPYAFQGLVGLTVLLSIGLLIYFKRQKWL